jgi:uncharacterized Zn finger protein (UPF0148 family)
MTENDGIQQLQNRRQFFADHFPAIGQGGRANVMPLLENTCPACGFPTLGERSGWEICWVCFWEDDGQDEADADKVWGGPNGGSSLTKYRLETANKLTELQDESRKLTEIERRAGKAVAELQSLMDSYVEGDKPQLLQYLDKATVALIRCGIGK